MTSTNPHNHRANQANMNTKPNMQQKRLNKTDENKSRETINWWKNKQNKNKTKQELAERKCRGKQNQEHLDEQYSSDLQDEERNQLGSSPSGRELAEQNRPRRWVAGGFIGVVRPNRQGAVPPHRDSTEKEEEVGAWSDEKNVGRNGGCGRNCCLLEINVQEPGGKDGPRKWAAKKL